MSSTVKSERLTQRCPGCGRLLRIPPEMAGQEVACKFCDHPVKVGAAEDFEPSRGLSHVGTGTAFQIERVWVAGKDREARFTIVKHPLKQGLRGYSLAVECGGPSRIQMAGIKSSDGQAVSLGKVRPGEIRVVPLDDVCHAYLWLEKSAKCNVKIVVARAH